MLPSSVAPDWTPERAKGPGAQGGLGPTKGAEGRRDDAATLVPTALAGEFSVLVLPA